MSSQDRCRSCDADRTEILSTGHRMLNSRGQPAYADEQNVLVCPESCTCLPECFSMAEHHGLAVIDIHDQDRLRADKTLRHTIVRALTVLYDAREVLTDADMSSFQIRSALRHATEAQSAATRLLDELARANPRR